MKKKTLSLLLALCMVLALFPVSAFAADGDFAIEDGVLTKYNGGGGDVVIPDGVTEIGDYAFAVCRELTGVTIPNSVTSIGRGAFQYCTGLTSVTIPSSVTDMGDGVFSNCKGLTSVTISSGVTCLGDWAFQDCTGLTSVAIPGSMAEIDRGAFKGCSGLTSVTISSGVTSIARNAFDGCESLTDVYYAGTEEQWGAVEIDNKFLGNSYLLDATVHCNSAMPEATAEPDTPAAVSFTDVPADHWAASGITWAVENGITNGTGDNTFSPEKTCSHVEIVTFLWRASGSPAANGTAPIQVESWFADAVNWAYGEGIIDDSFTPGADCTRADTVTYMWKAAGSPAEAETGSFADVPAKAEYAQAVAWAVSEGVTTGTGDGTFAPDITCTRAQIVTFLSRAYGE